MFHYFSQVSPITILVQGRASLVACEFLKGFRVRAAIQACCWQTPGELGTGRKPRWQGIAWRW
eukprot:2388990-Amphidinium_carterae.1